MGRPNTHKGYSDLAMLERKWREDLASDGVVSASQVKMAHNSAEGCYAFILWCAQDGGRARSLGTTVRQLSSLCSKLEIINYANSSRVQALLKELTFY